VRRLALAVIVLVSLTACGKKVRVASAPAPSPRTSTAPAPNRPPEVSRPASPDDSELRGIASYYAEPFQGRRTANGEVFDSYEQMTAAHRTLPFNTVVKVTNRNNGRDVEVRINDRGPFVDGRVIDLSLKAARELDMVRSGVAPVQLEIVRQGTPTPRGTSRSEGAFAPPVAALYAVQVGAFDTEQAALTLQQSLEKHYRDVTIQTFSATRTFYRVRVGRTADLASAEKLAKQLRDDSFDPFVVRLN